MMSGYGDRVRTFEEVKNLFNDSFPNRNPISKATVLKTVRRDADADGLKKLEIVEIGDD